MKQYEKALQRLAATVCDSNEQLPGIPIVELAGDRRVLIENHHGVSEYGENRICIKVKYGTLCVCGNRMELAMMTKAQLIITGQIDSVTILRKAMQ